jgi:hypothetical protein
LSVQWKNLRHLELLEILKKKRLKVKDFNCLTQNYNLKLCLIPDILELQHRTIAENQHLVVDIEQDWSDEPELPGQLGGNPTGTKEAQDNWNEKPNCNSQLTTFRFISLFLKTADKQKLTHSSKNKLLYLISLLFSSKAAFPSSVYRLKKGLISRGILRTYNVHYNCPKCGTYAGREHALRPSSKCSSKSCLQDLRLEEIQPYSFVTMSLKPVLTKLLENGHVEPSIADATNCAVPAYVAQVVLRLKKNFFFLLYLSCKRNPVYHHVTNLHYSKISLNFQLI